MYSHYIILWYFLNVGEIKELGLVVFNNSKITLAITPQFNVYYHLYYDTHNRWNTTLSYLEEYASYHPHFIGVYYG